MAFRNRAAVVCAAVSALVLFSCAKKEKESEKSSAAVDSTLSYVSDEVSFGLFFDAEFTKRTVEVKGDKEATLYVVVSFPVTMQIAAVEYRLILPEGVTIENDKYYDMRVALLGTFEHGISETFPCAPGPRIVLHELRIKVPAGLKDAEISLMPSLDGKILAVATCDEGNPIIEASAYKAIINPTD